MSLLLKRYTALESTMGEGNGDTLTILAGGFGGVYAGSQVYRIQ